VSACVSYVGPCPVFLRISLSRDGPIRDVSDTDENEHVIFRIEFLRDDLTAAEIENKRRNNRVV